MSVHFRKIWSNRNAIVFGRFPPTTGQFTVADADRVYAASGLTDVGRVVALDRRTGEQAWDASLDGNGGAGLQGAADGVVVANNYNQLVGLDADRGETRWRISLSSLGLEGYWPTRSAVTDGISAIGLSAHGEGDVRPPVILGVRTATGEVVWRTALEGGTDLTWAAPPVRNGATIFLSTLSHPASAPGNVAHLLDLADGRVRWTVALGGSQAFSTWPAVFDQSFVVLPAVAAIGEVRSVDQANGVSQWSAPGLVVLPTVDGLWTLRPDYSLALLDPRTGGVLRTTSELIESQTPAPAQPQLVDLNAGLVGVAIADKVAIINRQGTTVLQRRTLGSRIDQVARAGVLYIATADNEVTAYQIRLVSETQ